MNCVKKFIVMIVVGMMFAICNYQTAFAYPRPVALVTNYDDIADGIAIQRANGAANGSEALLYPGDVITGNVGYVKIQCVPYADFRARNGAYIISYNPPSGIWGIAQNAIDYASSFWDNVETVVSGASRGNEKDLNLKPSPGFDVTLMMNHKVLFEWENKSVKNFVVKDGKGSKIFEKNIIGLNKVEIDLNQLKFSRNGKYTWSLDSFGEYRFTILDEQTEKEIIAKLAEIDSENISEEARILKKSTYVQLISDLYPEKIDLYWLSVQWLSKLSPTTEARKNKKFVMLKKCSQHLDDEM